MHQEDVVHTANAKAVAKECKFCLRILAQLNTFVHCSNDVCFGQELICDELTWFGECWVGPVRMWCSGRPAQAEAWRPTFRVQSSDEAQKNKKLDRSMLSTTFRSMMNYLTYSTEFLWSEIEIPTNHLKPGPNHLEGRITSLRGRLA